MKEIANRHKLRRALRHVQVVHTSRSLALSEAEREAETKALRVKVDELKQEAARRVP